MPPLGQPPPEDLYCMYTLLAMLLHSGGPPVPPVPVDALLRQLQEIINSTQVSNFTTTTIYSFISLKGL